MSLQYFESGAQCSAENKLWQLPCSTGGYSIAFLHVPVYFQFYIQTQACFVADAVENQAVISYHKSDNWEMTKQGSEKEAETGRGVFPPSD